MFTYLPNETEMYLILVLLISIFIWPVCAKVVASYVLPHGGIALDPTHFNSTNATAKRQAWEIHDACEQIGVDIAVLKPDVVLLSTPHGISDLKNFVMYLNPKAEGFADTNNCKCPPCCYSTLVDIDVDLSEEIIQSAGFTKNVSGLSGYGPPGKSDKAFPLRWGEVIPFHFLHGLTNMKAVILSQPSHRYSQGIAMIPELLSLDKRYILRHYSITQMFLSKGSSLYMILEKFPKRIVIIISADLAHTHDANGPYGYSNSSEPFDEACGQWASHLDSDALLVTAASYVDQALSCGYTGLVLLHGLMQAGDLKTWTPRLLVNHHPSYYGMMVAAFHRGNEPTVTVF